MRLGLVWFDQFGFSQRTGRRLSKPEVDATFREFDQNKVKLMKSYIVYQMHYQVPVAGQQAELQRVLRDDEQKETTVDLRKPGGETEQIVEMHFFCVCLS